jgi:hypothetical protein
MINNSKETMAAPKGNQYALGNNGGRPREWDRQEEAKALLEWASQEDALVLRKFAPLRGYPPEYLWEWEQTDQEFSNAIKKARAMIGARREELLIQGKGNASPFHRYAALYDPQLKSHEKEMKQAEIDNKQYVLVKETPFDQSKKAE